jgi:hypothetical protein
MTEFIFMLTHHDVTIADAVRIFDSLTGTGLSFAGCKDMGLPMADLRTLFSRMRDSRISSFLEIVSASEEDHFEGVRKAVEIGADFLIGGMPEYTEKTISYLKGNKKAPKFLPYVGRIVGHPCVLRGTISEIVNDAKRTQVLGGDGINLLAYRYDGNIAQLITSVCSSVDIPVIVAGNVDSYDKIRQLRRAGVWAFTIGGAIFERKFLQGESEFEQVKAILRELSVG